MSRWILYLAIAIITAAGMAGEAMALPNANPNANVNTAVGWCYNMITSQGAVKAIISPLITCFTDTTQGIIPSVTQNYLINARTYYMPVVGIMFIIAIAYYGMRIMIGDVRRLKADTIVLGLKMAGILLFLNNAQALYLDMLGILQQFSQTMSNASTQAHANGFCTSALVGNIADNSAWQQGLWSRWDCIFQYLLGFGAAAFAASSIAAFLFLMLFSASTGIAVFFIGLALILWLLSAAFRFIHIYFMSVLSLSFMFCLGYMFVPLLLFRNTFDYFRKWLTMVFGFIITPIIMFGFMGMMLVALDIVIFSGQSSVYCAIGGPPYCGNAAASANMFSNMTADMVAGQDEGGVPNTNLNDSFMNFMYLALGNYASEDAACGAQAWTGALGTGCNLNQPGTTYGGTQHGLETRIGFEMTGFNLTAMAINAGSQCISTTIGPNGGATPISYYSACPYVENILVAMCVAALMTYIMSSLITFIPSLASSLTQGLVSQDLASMGKQVLQSAVFGEQGAKDALGAGQAVAESAAQGENPVTAAFKSMETILLRRN